VPETAPDQRMTLLIDECVPHSVAAVFSNRGHTVHFVTDLLAAQAADPLIAVAGNRLEAIVVTWNHKDFKSMTARVPEGNVQKFRRLSRISFRMNESQGAHRAQELIESIEFEYQQVQKKRDRRLLIEIGTTVFRIIR
jgi:predicted nuclease of predicted toxin-antitoxin system